MHAMFFDKLLQQEKRMIYVSQGVKKWKKMCGLLFAAKHKMFMQEFLAILAILALWPYLYTLCLPWYTGIVSLRLRILADVHTMYSKFRRESAKNLHLYVI